MRVGAGFTITRYREVGEQQIILAMEVAESVKSAMPKIQKMLLRMVE